VAWPAVSGWGTHDFVDATTGVLQRDVSSIFLEVLRRDPTLLGHFKTGKAATNREVEWFDRAWVPFQFSTATSTLQTDSSTDETLTAVETLGAKNIARWFEPGDLFMLVGSAGGTSGVLPAQPEVYQVVTSTESTNVIVLDRVYGGSTSNYASAIGKTANAAVTVALWGNLYFEKLGPVTPENSSPNGDKTHTHGPAEKNYTQIFSYDLDVSGTSLAMNQYNMSDYFGTNLKELTEELKLQLERTAIYGLQNSNVPSGSDAYARTMNGIKYYIDRAAGNRIITGYTTPNEELINALCRKIIRKNGQLDNRKGILACSPANAEVIADIWKDKIQINREDTVRGTQVKTIVTKLGFSLDVVWDPNIHNNDLMILNPSKLEIVPLQGRAWFVKRYDNGTDGQTARVLGEWTTRVYDSLKDHAICTCLTTTD
jgi:hypothetical protein